MRRTAVVIFIAAICLAAARAAPHGGGDDDDDDYNDPLPAAPVPSNGPPGSGNPDIDYTAPVKEHGGMDMDMDTGDGMGGMDMDKGAQKGHNSSASAPLAPDQMSYWLWPEHRGLLYTHICLMIVSWGFLLPVGVMLGVAQSPFHIPVQLAFLALTTVGVVFAIMYNSATPDFYDNNAHHKIGWVIIWMLVAQVVSGLIRGVARYVKPSSSDLRDADLAHEAENIFTLGDENEDDLDEDAQDVKLYRHKRTTSDDSGNDTGTNTPRGQSSSASSPVGPRRSSENTLFGDDPERHIQRSMNPVPLRNTESEMEQYLAKKLQGRGWAARISRRGAFLAKIVHAVIGRPMWCLGFIQVCTGIVTVTGIFKSYDIYNGLAHFIKGGIFFNYGIITLGRYCGVFADFGWAWNLKPPSSLTGQKWRDNAPSAEMVESSVIFVYGATQQFMEHLGNHEDGLWSHKDLEHVSIAIMFMWAGLCGILMEVRSIRRFFNQSIEALIRPSRREISYQMVRSSVSQSGNIVNPATNPPKQHGFSYNPFPGLIIFMTGLMMSMHHQESMLSTMIHKQWGYLLAGFSIFRLGTYFLLYLDPPSSYIPTRPMTELLASFCLICGGLMFMVSNSDTVDALDAMDLDAMFVFNLSVAFSSLIMAWIFIVMAIKGWSVQRRRA